MDAKQNSSLQPKEEHSFQQAPHQSNRISDNLK